MKPRDLVAIVHAIKSKNQWQIVINHQNQTSEKM